MRIVKESEITEASFSRLLTHAKDQNTFAVIGSRDKDTEKDRSSELRNLIDKISLRSPNDKTNGRAVGTNTLTGRYTYKEGPLAGQTATERSYIIYNISKQDALDIAKKVNQESIIWKDKDFFGIIDTNTQEVYVDFDKKSITFDQKTTDENGSKLKSKKAWFAFESYLKENEYSIVETIW